jgi:hypothetical protein
MPILLADDPDEALDAIAPHLAHQFDSYAVHEVEGTDQEPPPPVDPYDLVRPGPQGEQPRFQVLTADQAATYLRQRIDGLPVEHLILWAGVAAMPDGLVDRHVELVCGDLTRALQEQP